MHHALGDAWYRAAEFRRLPKATRPLAYLLRAILSRTLNCCSRSHTPTTSSANTSKRYAEAEQARSALQQLEGLEAARQMARSCARGVRSSCSAWARTPEALEWAARAVTEGSCE